MGRLKSLPSRFGAAPYRIRLAPDQGRQAQRSAAPWRNWYGLAEWRRLRQRVFLRDCYTCQWPGCGKLEGDTSKLVADHKRPHRGNRTLFFDETNVWTLCPTCHSSAKQREEQDTLHQRGIWD